LDNLLNIQTGGVLFTGNFVQADSFNFNQYLSNVVQQVKYMNGFSERKMFYLCKDIPLFHHFHFKEIAAFKYYFWMKNILHLPEFTHKKFSMSIYPDEYFELGRQALHYYNQVNSTEIWNIESVNSTLRQVEFYHDSNIFADEKEIYVIYDALQQMINHLEQQATLGYKFDVGDASRTPLASYEMYFNEIVIMENSILVQLDNSRAAFLVHNVLNFMLTRDVKFCDVMHGNIQNLVRKSTLISTVSERERARFFKYLRQKIEGRKRKIK
jgi:hypothetical protein